MRKIKRNKIKGGIKMKFIKILLCLSFASLLPFGSAFAYERIGIEEQKTEVLKLQIQRTITAKKIPMKHFSSEVSESAPVLVGFDNRDAPWSTNILASDGWGQDDPDQYTSMAVGPDGAVYVAYAAMYQGGTDWDFGIARSTDNGQSWSSNALGTANDERNPDVVVDDEGYVWIFCTLDDGSQGKRAFTRSDNPNSIGFSSLYSFDGSAGDYYIDPSAWGFGGESSADLHVFTAWSYDDGANDDQMHIMYNDPVGQWNTWSMGSFSEDGDTDMNPDVAISDNNVIMANIEDVSGADQELRIWYLDIGSVWSGGSWNIWEYTITGDDAYPSIFSTGTNVFVSFQNDAGSGDWNIIHGNSTDDGGTWDLGAYVANSANAEQYPRVSGLSDITGVVYLEKNNVKFRQSGSLGQAGTWEPELGSSPERVTDQDAGDESIRSASLFHTGEAWVATWADDRNFGSKDLDIWSSYRDVGAAQISTNPPTPDSFVYFDFTSTRGFGKLGYITKQCERTYSPIISDGVQESIENALEDEFIGILITMKKQVSHDYLLAKTSVMSRKQRRHFVWKELSKFAEETQHDILNYLSKKRSEGKAKRIGTIFTGNRVRGRVTKDVIKELAQRSDIGWITPEVRASTFEHEGTGTSEIPGEPRSVEANLSAINADLVWAQGYTGSGVICGHMDTGANYNHNDLNDHLWDGGFTYPNGGYDFENNDNDPSDDNGHGSVTAGIVCGDGTNGDTTGVAPDAEIMILRTGTNADMSDAVDFVISGGSGAGDPADVLTSSVGFERGQFSSDAQYQSMKNYFRPDAVSLLSAGICWTYAAGNGDSYSGGHYNVPLDIIIAADCPPPWLHPDQTITGGLSSVITAGATNNSRARQSWSSYGPTEWDNGSYSDYPYGGSNHGLLKPDIMAPGYNITSLSNSGQGYSGNNHGTSFSAPHLCGAIALMISKDPSLTPSRIDSILENTTQDVTSYDPAGKDSLNGSGFLDVFAACFGIGTAKEAILWVKNDPASTGYLIVSDITHKEPWVVKVEPTSFSVAPGDSQAVDVWADTTGYGPFKEGPNNFDTLFITSNSQSKTTTAVQVILDYPGETNISMTNLTATGYYDRIELNWRTMSEFSTEAWQIMRSDAAEGEYNMVGALPGYGSSAKPRDYSFSDNDVTGGKRYFYKIVKVDNMGKTTYGPVSAVSKSRPTLSSLKLASNPSRNGEIHFNIGNEAQVSLKIYNLSGRLVKTLINNKLSPQNYTIKWDGTDSNGKDVCNGVYFIRMNAEGAQSTLKLTLLK